MSPIEGAGSVPCRVILINKRAFQKKLDETDQQPCAPCVR